ncbi:hypothetical protein OUZ56_027022 [Daphnia magna]|uniref:Uncharacterized protein n=1 Tax=Daphnia magna TaxID=35525 RepID=A0ABQ9ZNV5_9CRUS|nr:hypothetical protein OUZ56_027022 [Daphnia magna]
MHFQLVPTEGFYLNKIPKEKNVNISSEYQTTRRTKEIEETRMSFQFEVVSDLSDYMDSYFENQIISFYKWILKYRTCGSSFRICYRSSMLCRGHAPTVISSKGCECAVRKGDVGVLKFCDIIGGRRGYPQIRINDSVRNRTLTIQHALPMLNHRAVSPINNLTVSLSHLRLQIQLDAVKHGMAAIGSHKTTMI